MFKKGPQGTGYYRDEVSPKQHGSLTQAGKQPFVATPAAETSSASDDDGVQPLNGVAARACPRW